jgi:hypothetical protein
MVLPTLVALGVAYLVWLLMEARIRVLTAQYQTAVAKAENDGGSRRPALDDLLAELRTERRRFVRRVAGPRGNETTLITQERLYLRNIPLTSWMEEDLVLGNGEELPAETVTPLIEAVPGQSLTVA